MWQHGKQGMKIEMRKFGYIIIEMTMKSKNSGKSLFAAFPFLRGGLARFQLSIFMAIAVCSVSAQSPGEWEKLERSVNFYIANDLGRNGYYDQKPIAETMGRMAESVSIECVAALGDVHHFEGVRSISDPLWMTNYEMVYSHPGLMLPWYPVLGNHEYRGNTSAVLGYSEVSARWMMPSRYYTRVLKGNDVSVRLVFLDTTPMIGKYRQNGRYPDVALQDCEAQLAWADSVLSVSHEDWVIVLGHHPVYACTGKDESERADMQARLGAVLLRHGNVNMYVCGHIHNFQHIRKPGCGIDYIVNTSGSLSRPDVGLVDGTLFCSGVTGFSLVCADKQELALHLIDKDGRVLYTVEQKKQFPGNY